MQLPPDLEFLATTLQHRRQKLAQQIAFPVVLWSGRSSARNFPANTYPFRANSHFLYFAGLQLENAAIRLESGKLHLFMDNASAGDALWHGESLSRDNLAEILQADAASPLADLPLHVADAATLPIQDAQTRTHQSHLLGRTVERAGLEGRDRHLAEAVINLRLIHDPFAQQQIQQAAQVSVKAHQAGMAATATAQTEAEIRAAMEAVLIAHQMPCAYGSIVTTHGEVLHHHASPHNLQAGDLLLADVGGETPLGWAADITRTWPVSGQFSSTQKEIYEVVLAAHDACIAEIRPGVEYRQIHLLAAQVIATGLVDLGILRGDPQELVARDAPALFFPHGIGHLLGLDVHDMEDLGDLAGYAAGRGRSDRLGLGFLRLDRPLQPGMIVTIEPGFYQVPALLQDLQRRVQYQDCVNWERLHDFADVRGIRIEDDVLVTATSSQVLTADLETTAGAIAAVLCL
jgi:Xaa-Pro aminopeptidase